MSATIETYPDRAAWLAARRNTIGSSDAPVILGLGHKAESHARMSLIELWSLKTGKVQPTEEDSVRLRAGHYLELPTIQEAKNVNPSLILSPPRNLQSWVDGIRSATPDLYVRNHRAEGPATAVCEVKTVEAFAADDWADGPSAYSLVQLHHQLIVGGWQEGWIAAWIGFGRFELHHVERDPELEELILEREEDFWRHVQQDIEPPADASESASRTLRKLHPKDSGEVVRVEDPELAASASHLVWLKGQVKELTEQVDGIENSLKQRIGDATELVILADGEATARYSWKWSNVKPEDKPRAGYEKRTLRRLKT